MSAHHGYSSYSTSSARHSSPGIQVSMLLAAAARHMEAARDAIRVMDIEARFNATEKCATIISGLRSCLNRDTPAAATVSDTLDGYYARLLTFLTQINIKNDLTLAESVVDSLRTMSSAWREVQARADAEGQATPTSQSATAVVATDSHQGESTGSNTGFAGVSA